MAMNRYTSLNQLEWTILENNQACCRFGTEWGFVEIFVMQEIPTTEEEIAQSFPDPEQVVSSVKDKDLLTVKHWVSKILINGVPMIMILLRGETDNLSSIIDNASPGDMVMEFMRQYQ